MYPHDLSEILPDSWGGIRRVMVSSAICNQVGAFHQRDVLCWNHNGCLNLGRAIQFLEVHLENGCCEYMAMMFQFEHHSGRKWSEVAEKLSLVEIEQFGPVFSWIEVDDGLIEALLPTGV